MKPRNRSKWRAFVSSPFTLVAALVLLGFLAKAAWNIYGKAQLSQRRLDQAQSEIDKLTASQADLSAKTADLSTEAGIEAELSEKYRAVAPGESVAVIVDPATPGADRGTTASISGQPNVSAHGWWGSLLRMIGFK